MVWCGNGEGIIRTAHPALEGTNCGPNLVSSIILTGQFSKINNCSGVGMVNAFPLLILFDRSTANGERGMNPLARAGWILPFPHLFNIIFIYFFLLLTV